MSETRPIADVTAPDALTGTSVGRYEVRERLGVGSQGEVYLGWDGKLKRNVAIKRLAPALRADPVFRKRFLQEAEQTSRFADGHIASIYDLVEQGDDIFLVIEFIDGETLRSRMERPLPLGEFLSIASQCAEALRAAEQHRIVHCDIKPENIMLTRTGQVKILDFGVAKRLPRNDSESTQDLSKMHGGTPAYMAPEVLQEGEATSASDVFSLGVVFYEALTGMHPFRASNFFLTSHNILQVSPPGICASNPEVPQTLAAVVERMLAKDRAQRYSGAEALLRDLHSVQLASGEGVRPLPAPLAVDASATVVVTRPRPLQTWARRLVIPLVLIASVIGWRWWPRHTQQAMHLAILPLSPCADDTGSRAFCDGLTETLNAKVSQIGRAQRVDVVPSNEIQNSKTATAAQARSEFGVSHVLEGSLQRSGGMVRINWSLVDTTTLRQIRSDTITEPSADTFALQDRVVASVLKLLDLNQNAPGAPAKSYGTTQLQAYDFYLRGRGYLNDLDRPESLSSAVAVFRHALEVDPAYAQAYAGLGTAYWRQYQLSRDSSLPAKALDACNRASALAPAIADGLACLGLVLDGTGKYEAAADNFNKALTIEPSNVEARAGLAHAYANLGQFKEAEENLLTAQRMRPEDQMGYQRLGSFYYHQGRLEDAARQFQQATELAPDNSQIYSSLAGIRLAQGHWADAGIALQRALAIRPQADAYSNLGVSLFYQGKFPEAADAFQKAFKLSPKVFRLAGNVGEALYWIPARRAEAGAFLLDALDHAQEESRLNPRDPDPLSASATYEAFLGHSEQARALVRRCDAISTTASNVEFEVRLAKALVLSGDSAGAEARLKTALQQGYSAALLRDDPAFASLVPKLPLDTPAAQH